MDALVIKKRTLKAEITCKEKAVTILAGTDTNAIIVNQGKVSELQRDCAQLLDDIAAVSTDEQFEKEEEELAELDKRLVQWCVQLMNLQVSQSSSLSSPEVQVSDVKLPKLQLPTFTGNLYEWLSFHDLFIASVHSNNKLSGAQKLQYLKTSLKGEPAQLLQAMQITDRNYKEAWDILCARYHNKREIVSAILKRLITQPSLQQESATGLRKLIDTTMECTRSLQVLEQPIQHWDAILVYHIADKVDSETRRQWELSLK